MFEPIQGEAGIKNLNFFFLTNREYYCQNEKGVVVPDAGYYKGVREVCNKWVFLYNT